jgi:Flp pilus assembly protein CpaB
MQTTLNPPRPSGDGKGPKLGRDRNPLSSKQGSVLAALVTAVLAGIVIMVFLNQYRDNVNKDGVPTPVLVATKLIDQGASGASIGNLGLFRTEQIPRDQLKAGAITDGAELKGKVAAEDILPGQQLTASSFTTLDRPVIEKLGPDDRAMRVSVDAAHGMTGELRRGDHVDIYSGFIVRFGSARNRPVLRPLMQDLLVLDAPKIVASGSRVGGGAKRKSEVTLRVTSRQGPKLAFAADNGEVWLALRPANARNLDEEDQYVTLESLLTVRGIRGGAGG